MLYILPEKYTKKCKNCLQELKVYTKKKEIYIKSLTKFFEKYSSVVEVGVRIVRIVFYFPSYQVKQN